MDDFDNLIERYRRELMEFSRNNCSKPAADNNSVNETKPCKKEEMEEIFQERTAIPVVEEKGNAMPVNSETAIETAVDKAEEKSLPQIKDFETASKENSVGNPSVPKFKNYEEFIKGNPQNGSLKVQVFAADHAFPVPNARVVVVLELQNGTKEFFDGLTDINGIVDDIILPAPARESSQAPSDSPALPYSSYTTYVEHPDFVEARYTDVPVFAGIKSIQGVELIPLVSVGNEPKYVETDEGDSFERLKGVVE
ncbi:MAG: hypothetical protein MJ120_01700 [Clostridia bacterium]|nr:hypothetical protein [Clostridia bacterium]